MEPTRQSSGAIMSQRRAAHSEALAGLGGERTIMSNEQDMIDPACQEYTAAMAELFTANPMIDQASALALIEKANELAGRHRSSCVQCQAYAGIASVKDERSAIWGGATLGLLVGLTIGWFRDSYWETVLYSVLIGAGCGLAADALARVGNRLLRRQ
jgi:hypothetical protein